MQEHPVDDVVARVVPQVLVGHIVEAVVLGTGGVDVAGEDGGFMLFGQLHQLVGVTLDPVVLLLGRGELGHVALLQGLLDRRLGLADRPEAVHLDALLPPELPAAVHGDAVAVVLLADGVHLREEIPDGLLEFVAELGLEVPTTWDEFLAVLDAIKADGTYTPLAEGNQDQWPGAHYIGTLNQMLVADDVRAADFNPKTGAFTDPGYVEALDKYQQLVPYMNIGVNGMTHDMARQLFTTGQAAMCYIELVEITNLYQETEGTEFNWGMFVFPTVEGAGNPNILTGEPEGFVISANTDYPDECVEFLKWFLGPEVGAQQAEVVGWFNASKGVADNLEDEGLREAYDLIMNAEEMGPWFDASLYSTVCEEYLQQISNVTNGDISSADAMAKIQATALEAQTLAAE